MDGALGARGRVSDRLLQRLLAEPYYTQIGPKSTGQELFHLPYVLAAMEDLEPVPKEDLVATLTALTARTVVDAVIRAGGTEVIAAGGGTHNPTLMRMLADALDDVGLSTTATLGVPVEAREAYAFVTLGFLPVHGLPGSVPSCTGARHASILGSVTLGHRPLTLLAPPSQPPRRLRVAPASPVADPAGAP